MTTTILTPLTPISITIHLSQSCGVPCDRCGGHDGRDGILLEDDTRKVFCRWCTMELVRRCIQDGRWPSFEPSAPRPAARRRRQPQPP
jgi:hypothetical protein